MNYICRSGHIWHIRLMQGIVNIIMWRIVVWCVVLSLTIVLLCIVWAPECCEGRGIWLCFWGLSYWFVRIFIVCAPDCCDGMSLWDSLNSREIYEGKTTASDLPELVWYGRSGMKTDYLKRKDSIATALSKSIKSDFACLIIGGNDLDESNPNWVPLHGTGAHCKMHRGSKTLVRQQTSDSTSTGSNPAMADFYIVFIYLFLLLLIIELWPKHYCVSLCVLHGLIIKW
jgi:hypothetical protein